MGDNNQISEVSSLIQPVPTTVVLDETPGEECGVFGVFAPESPVAHLTYAGLYALQHRGQEAAGMAVSDGSHLFVVKDTGLVTHAFDERKLASLDGHLAIGHVRYATTGASSWVNAQPVFRAAAGLEFALGHNGNLVNTRSLTRELGVLEGTVGTDSEVIAEMVLEALVRLSNQPSPADQGDPKSLFTRALFEVLPKLQGAFSLLALDQHALYGVRDPNGFRPLCLGRVGSDWVLASETAALDIVGAHFVREVEPGELVVIDETGCRSYRPFRQSLIDPTLCVFEFVYFARPDSILYGQMVHSARHKMGVELAMQAPLPPDPLGREAIVMPVPESGVPAAQGFAKASGVPYQDGLTKNRYIGRTFIAPNQQMRALGVRMKLNPLRDNIAGKRLVVVDDSIVRGTTTRQIVKMLREAGAAEVHLRVSSPPYKWPCYYGMDTGRRGELLAANMDLGEIRDYLGCDSIAYLSLEGLLRSTGVRESGFCTACLTGAYPVGEPETLVSADGRTMAADESSTHVQLSLGTLTP